MTDITATNKDLLKRDFMPTVETLTSTVNSIGERSRSRPMASERVAFVGGFIDPSKAELDAYVMEHGGKAQNFVSADTTMVVVGSYHTAPAKLIEADELNQHGAGIRIVALDDFLEESKFLNEPVVNTPVEQRLPMTMPPAPDMVDGEPVFQTRRARRDHERMTEALAILKIDERTGRAYHGELPKLEDHPVATAAAKMAAPVLEPEVIAAAPRLRGTNRSQVKISKSGPDMEDLFVNTLWIIPLSCFAALVVSVLFNSEVMTFVCVATTLSSMALLTFYRISQRNGWLANKDDAKR